MAEDASIAVYLQALGGKFLGPNAYNPENIQISFLYKGGGMALPYYQTGMDDGTISGIFTAGASSFMPILTMGGGGGQPVVHYLAADSNTVAGKGEIELSAEKERAELVVSIPRSCGGPLMMDQSVLLVKELTGYKITIVVPGLFLSAGSRG